MEKDEDYEIIPHKEIIELKKEIEHLKKNPFGKGKNAENLLDAVNDLNDNISNLIKVFNDATNELKNEKYNKEDSNLLNKINDLFEQNKEIAEAIVSVAEMVKEEKKDINTFQQNVKPFFKPPEQMKAPEQVNPPFQQMNFNQRSQFPPSNFIPSNNNFNVPPPGNPNPIPDFGRNQNSPSLDMDLPPPPPKGLEKKNNEFPF
jgi:ABC-type transporter Mla subunit MlaD